MNKKVAIGFSGGVDSSVATDLLKKEGYEVIGIHFQNRDDVGNIAILEEIARNLKIKFQVIDLRDSFQQLVYNQYVEKLRHGLTPNPCVFCNKVFKFGQFLEYVKKKFDVDFMATGHYAMITKNKKLFQLKVPKDIKNDQTYFLHQLSQSQLARVLFPLGHLTKDEVRNHAKSIGLKNFNQKSSTDICFLNGVRHFNFLCKHLEKKYGKIIEASSGYVLGNHIGLPFYTLGQRKNLHIGGVRGFPEKPWFVVGKNVVKNELYVSQDETMLLSFSLNAYNINWIAGERPKDKFRCKARIRFRSVLHDCEVRLKDNHVSVKFDNPIFGITAGQYVVFYKGAICLGGGEIY